MSTKYVTTKAMPLDELTPYPGNARIGQVPRILDSLRRNGQYRTIVVRRVGHDHIVLAGNHTRYALIEHGPKPCDWTWTEKDDDGTVIAEHPCAVCLNREWDNKIRSEIVTCDDDTARNINLVDNRIPDLSGYDEALLSDQLRELDTASLLGTGWYEDDEDLARILAGADYTPKVPADADTADAPADGSEGERIPEDIGRDEPVPLVPENPVTRKGDVWTLGDHRLMCGDCRERDDVDRLLSGAVVNLAFTSPPYAAQREYDTDSGFQPVKPDDYVEWFKPVADNVQRALALDGSWFVNIKAAADGLDTYLYVHELVIAHARQWGWHYATELCWRRIGVPKSVTRRFKNQFEPIYQFVLGDFKMIPERVRHESDSVPVPAGPGAGDTSWAGAQGGNGRMFGGQGNVTRDTMSNHQGEEGENGPTGGRHGTNPGLAYPGNVLPTFSGDHQATGHTAAFPVGLPQWFVRVYSDPEDVVYDPFCGSGSTLLACEREGRKGFGMEISAKYCDVAARRYQQVTGTVPLLNGEPYDLISNATS